MTEDLRYKLKMFRVPINGPAEVLCENKSVVIIVSVTESVLSNKNNSTCYHRVREAQTVGTINLGWVKGEYSKSDTETKMIISTKRQN